MLKKLYVYISESANPYINLATEKALFDMCDKDSFILYLWQNKNTVVIGRNQNPLSECNIKKIKADSACIARRPSGGGAVFHDLGNLNFTFICHTGDYSLDTNMEIIKRACLLAGVKTEPSGRNDILADGRKFSGNAFYNSDGKTYHHGTLMINADKDKMTRYLTPGKAKLEAKGVKSVRSRVINLNEISPGLSVALMKDYIIDSAKAVLKLDTCPANPGDFSKIESEAAVLSSDAYIFGKSAPYTVFFEDRFAWGSVRAELSVEKGIISLASLYTDSMDWTLSDKFANALSGCEFNRDKLNDTIKKYLPRNIGEDIANMIISQL